MTDLVRIERTTSWGTHYLLECEPVDATRARIVSARRKGRGDTRYSTARLIQGRTERWDRIRNTSPF